MKHQLHPLRAKRRSYEGRFAWNTGLTAAWRLMGPVRRRVVILNYHHVDRDSFAAQMDWLLAEFRPVSLGEAVAYLGGGRPRGDWRVCITFDDGLDSFLDGPYPVLVERGIPATVYAIPGLMGQVPFWERVDHAFAGSAVREFQWAGQRWDHASGRVAARTRKRILHGLKRLTDPARRADLVAELETALAAELRAGAADRPPPRRLMTWAETTALDPKLVNIGAHSTNHPSLGRAEADVLAREIVGCRKLLEDGLGRPVADYCYPYGRRVDVGPAAEAMVREAGFRSAVTSITGIGAPGDDPYRIPRIGVTGREPRPAFAGRLSGLAPFLRGDF